MARVTKKKQAALDIIDFINLYDAINVLTINKQQIDYFEKVFYLIDKIILESGLVDQDAEIANHYLLCVTEIYLRTDLTPEKIHMPIFYEKMTPSLFDSYKEKMKNDLLFSLAKLLALIEIKGINCDFIYNYLSELESNKSLLSPPMDIRYRFAIRYYLFNNRYAAISFYCELLDMGILPSNKYRNKKTTTNKKEKKYAALRIGLLIEFEVFISNLAIDLKSKNTNKRINISKQKSIKKPFVGIDYYEYNIEKYYSEKSNIKKSQFISFNAKADDSKNEMEKLLINKSKLLESYPFFSGGQGKLISTLGAIMLEKEKRTLRNKNAIYCESENKGTISDVTSIFLQQNGLNISAKSIYLRHKDIKQNEFEKIEYYSHPLVHQGWIDSVQNILIR